jgi:hypothetical protein
LTLELFALITPTTTLVRSIAGASSGVFVSWPSSCTVTAVVRESHVLYVEVQLYCVVAVHPRLFMLNGQLFERLDLFPALETDVFAALFSELEHQTFDQFVSRGAW